VVSECAGVQVQCSVERCTVGAEAVCRYVCAVCRCDVCVVVHAEEAVGMRCEAECGSVGEGRQAGRGRCGRVQAAGRTR